MFYKRIATRAAGRARRSKRPFWTGTKGTVPQRVWQQRASLHSDHGSSSPAGNWIRPAVASFRDPSTPTTWCCEPRHRRDW